jgi:hypothetical protein
MAIAVTCPHCRARLRFRDDHAGKQTTCRACNRPVTVDGQHVPNYDVFICYSSKDKHIADAVCSSLEAKHIRCWMAPRDIRPGEEWAESIISAISQSGALVLIYSGNSNSSPQVLREVERAVSRGMMIIPFRVEDTVPTKSMEYFLGPNHWLDAMTPPLEQHIERLERAIHSMAAEQRKQQRAQAVVASREPAATPAAQSPASASVPVAGDAVEGQATTASPTRWRRAALVGIAMAVIATALAGAAYLTFEGSAKPELPGGGELPEAIAIPTTNPEPQLVSTRPTPTTGGAIYNTQVLAPTPFMLRRGTTVQNFVVTIPTIASGVGTMHIVIENMGDNAGDGGMYFELYNSENVMLYRIFGKRDGHYTYSVESGSKWTIALKDGDAGPGGNGGTITVWVTPKN